MNDTTRNEAAILADAAAALIERDKIHLALQQQDERIAALSREYGEVTRRWGYAPHHLRRAAQARGIMA